MRARASATIVALDPVSVTTHGMRMTVNGGNVNRASTPQTAQEWCAHYDVEINDDVATLYKAVDAEFKSYHGMSYLPGTQPQAPDWDGGEEECGGGIHLSPRPGPRAAADLWRPPLRRLPGPCRGHRHPPRRLTTPTP